MMVCGGSPIVLGPVMPTASRPSMPQKEQMSLLVVLVLMLSSLSEWRQRSVAPPEEIKTTMSS